MTIPPHNTHVSYIFLETWDKIKFIGDAYNHHDVHQEHQEPSGMSLKCYISHDYSSTMWRNSHQE